MITRQWNKYIKLIVYPLFFFYSYLSGWILWDFSLWSWIYLGLHFCSYQWTQRLCLILDAFIPPNSHVDRTAGEIAILGVCSLWQPVLLSYYLYLTDSFSGLKQPIRELLKRSASGQALSIIWLVIFHGSSNALPVNFWIQAFWIIHLT